VTQADHSACRIANKVAMHLRYATSTSDTSNSGPIVNEALLLTLQLFQLTNLETIPTRYVEQCERLFDSSTKPAAMAELGAQWNADACQQLRDMGFQEKLIAALGDGMDQWEPSFVPREQLTHSIQRLIAECSSDAIATTQALLTPGQSSSSVPPSSAFPSSAFPKLLEFSNAVCGFAILLIMLDQIDANEAAEKPVDSFVPRTLASFGAHLVASRDFPQTARG